ncbi:MAG: ribosome maturation factor RimP [Actinobacteria bacterium]|uniref:Ribosome maturation factor RimP n=1 Tax=Candidatus Fonsibacter lacus TaxID=2576439 RepID=A0A965GDK2_9PROT|nr:ribosome maturation factor RimP [Candidatus Fonsibacter lacus]
MTVIDTAVRSAIEPIITANNLFLEALHISTAGKHRIIRILVDGEKRLSLDEVTAITKPISEKLDEVAELGERPFTLEVSSPGVDFPLTLPRHWRKNKGRLVAIKIKSGEKITGRIHESSDLTVTIEMKAGNFQELSLSEVAEANIEIEFK